MRCDEDKKDFRKVCRNDLMCVGGSDSIIISVKVDASSTCENKVIKILFQVPRFRGDPCLSVNDDDNFICGANNFREVKKYSADEFERGPIYSVTRPIEASEKLTLGVRGTGIGIFSCVRDRPQTCYLTVNVTLFDKCCAVNSTPASKTVSDRSTKAIETPGDHGIRIIPVC